MPCLGIPKAYRYHRKKIYDSDLTAVTRLVLMVHCILQPGVVGQMMAAAEERPWLWVVYILIVAFPVFLVVLFCCSGKVRISSDNKCRL